MDQPLEARMKRLRFRAWHRGTREADYLMGCFFDRYADGWSSAELDWFEALLGQEDPDVLDWVMGTRPAPERFAGAQMDALQKLDFVTIPR